jgi:predicted nucleic acid-binding protein
MLYLDSSAIVKLIAPEPETAALVEMLRTDSEAISSALARVEVLRAVRRVGSSPERTSRAQEVLDRIALVPIDDDILHDAARLAPRGLRTLDAIHLATALMLSPDLESVITYDTRLSDAAVEAGLAAAAPA